MVVDNNLGRKGIALTVVLMIAVQLFRMDDSLHLCLLLSALCLACVGCTPLRMFSKLDIGFCLITIYEILSLLWTECPRASLGIAFYGLLYLNTYFVVRKLSLYTDVRHLIVNGTCIVFLVSLFLGLWSFFVFLRSAYTAGFHDIYHLRFLYTPLGYQVNVWAEVLIVMLGWGFLSRRFCYPLVFILILSILLSFSRGGYISLMVFLCLIVVLTKDKARKRGVVVSLLITAVLTLGIFHEEMTTTLKMTQTVSQRNSAESRVTATSVALEAFMKRPIVGYGSNNFTYAVDSLLYQDSRKAFSSIPPNIVSQFIVEKGIVGTIVYGFIIAALLVLLWKNKDRNECRIMFCLVIALVIKEMGQATMLDCPVTMMLIAILLALIQKDAEVSPKSKGLLVYMLASVSVVCLTLWNIPGVAYGMDDTAFKVKKALTRIDEFKRTANWQLLYTAKADLQESLEKHREDVSIKYLIAHIAILEGNDKDAYGILNELTTSYPNNAMFLLEMSELLYNAGEKDLSMKLFCKAVTLMPRLLKSEMLCKWENTDKWFYAKLQKRLRGLKPSVNASPAGLARYGYIAIWCKNPKGRDYLNQAVSLMPSLAIPWKLLGDARKYKLLSRGAFQRSSSLSAEREDPSTASITGKQIFLYHYRVKFGLWYGDDLE